MSNKLTTDEMLAALGWRESEFFEAPIAEDEEGNLHISGNKIVSTGVCYDSFTSAILAAYNAHKQAARRELAAKKLADLGWHVNDCVPWRPLALDANHITRIWPAGDPVEYWCIGDESGRCIVKDGGYESFDDAVDAAHAAKFPERQPLDETTFKRLIDEGQQDMKAFEAERRAGFPRKSEGRTAELNEPITMPDEDRCETSQTDLQAAEIERNWNDVAWLQAELIKARDRIAKQATKAAEKRTAYNAEIDRLKLQPGQPVATFDGKEWRTTVGSIEFMLASMEGEKSANVYWGVNTMLKITGASRGEVNQHVSDLLAFRGIRVQE